MQSKEFITEYLRMFSGQPKPPDKLREYVSDPALIDHIIEFEAAFPRYRIDVEDMIAEGNKVAIRATFRGVHQGQFAGVEGSGTEISTDLIVIYLVENSRITKYWLQFDAVRFMQQIESAPVGAR